MPDQTDEDRAREAYEAWFKNRYSHAPLADSESHIRQESYVTFLAGRASAEAEVERRDLGPTWSEVRTLFATYAERYQRADRYEVASAIADEAARKIVRALNPEKTNAD